MATTNESVNTTYFKTAASSGHYIAVPAFVCKEAWCFAVKTKVPSVLQHLSMLQASPLEMFLNGMQLRPRVVEVF